MLWGRVKILAAGAPKETVQLDFQETPSTSQFCSKCKLVDA